MRSQHRGGVSMVRSQHKGGVSVGEEEPTKNHLKHSHI